jgi:hypothetical protein
MSANDPKRPFGILMTDMLGHISMPVIVLTPTHEMPIDEPSDQGH